MGIYFTDIPDGSAVALDKSLLQPRFQSLDDAIVGIYNADANSDGIQQTKLLAPATLTITGDVVTRTQEWHRLDTESAAASDNLQTISGGVDGMKLALQIVSNSRVVTIKHNTGNIYLVDGMDRVLNDTGMTIVLMYSLLLTKWIEIDGTGYLGAREALGSSYTPLGQIVLPDRVIIGSSTRNRRLAVTPSLEVSNRWEVRAAAAAVQPIGIAALTNAATTVLTLSNQTDSTYVNVASGGSSGNCGGIGSTTFDLVRRQYNPTFEWIMTTGAAADIGNVRFWQGLFQQAPTNVASLSASTAAFAFRFDSALDTNWMGVTHDGTSQCPTPANTGVAVAANTRYKFRIRVDSTNGVVYFSVNDSAEVSLNVNLPATTQNLGFNLYNFTTAALAKNWLFSRAVCMFS